MNLLAEFEIEIKGSKKVLKLDNRALYKSQMELQKKGLLDLVSGIDSLDLNTIYTIAKHACVTRDVSLDQLLEADINLVDLAGFLAQQIAVLFTGKK